MTMSQKLQEEQKIPDNIHIFYFLRKKFLFCCECGNFWCWSNMWNF